MELNNIQGRKSARVMIYKESKYHFNVVDYDVLLAVIEENDGFIPQEVIDAISNIPSYNIENLLYQIEIVRSKYIISNFMTNKCIEAKTLEDAIEKVQEIIKSEYNCKVYFKVLKSKLKEGTTFKI